MLFRSHSNTSKFSLSYYVTMEINSPTSHSLLGENSNWRFKAKCSLELGNAGKKHSVREVLQDEAIVHFLKM